MSIGSSPRVWGKVPSAARKSATNWIIPTRVGKSNPSSARRTHPPDHPHACGEKFKCGLAAPFAIGSSPRVWGKAHEAADPTPDKRIIPTRVGKSSA